VEDAAPGWLEAEIRARLAELERAEGGEDDPAATVELDQTRVGRLSRMDALQGQQMAKAARRRRAAEARRLRAALDRLADGEHGFCDGCGEAIPEARLRIDPAATLCVACAR